MAPQDCDLVMAPAAWRWGRWRHPTDLCSCGSLDRGHKARDDSRECSMRAVRQASKTLRGVADLAAAGLVSSADLDPLGAVAARYAVAITADMVRLIDRGDPADPIARQFVPDVRELQQLPQERADPLGETQLSPVPGIVHRYPDRVLLKLTHVCPVYCRFCFRREVVGPGGPQALSGAALDAALGYIAGVPGIWEAILTGGDPLMLSPRRI